MKKCLAFAVIMILLILIVLILFDTNKGADSSLVVRPEQKIENDSLLSLEREADSLKTTVKELYARNKQIQKAYALQKNFFAQKYKHIDSLPADSQVIVFRSYTDSMNTAKKINDISYLDSIAEIPISNIRNANRKFVKLDAVGTKSEILEEFVSNQDSLVALYEASDMKLKSEINILAKQNNAIKEVMKQKEETFMRQKERFRLEIAGVGVLAILAIIF